MTAARALGSDQPGFVHLNRENAWLDFRRHGIEIDGGRLRLASLPALIGEVPPSPAQQPGPPTSPAGIAVAPDGTIYFTDADHHLIRRIDGCDGEERPLPCIGGEGSAPASLRDPCGLAVLEPRQALVVADTGNSRVQLFSLTTHELLDIWDGSPYQFQSPCAIAVDSAGHVYVVDRGTRRIQRFSADGAQMTSFWQTLAAEATFEDPVAVALAADDSSIVVLDCGRRVLVRVDPDGHVVEQLPLTTAGQLFGLVSGEDHYIGSNGPLEGTVLRLAADGAVIGPARGSTAFVAGLAYDRHGALLVHPGHGSPFRLRLAGACVYDGIAWGGPFGGFTPAPKAWYRCVAALDQLRPGDHIQLFVHTTDDPSAEPPVHEAGPDHFPAPAWSPGPPDLGEFLIRRDPSTVCWVGVRLSGEGSTSPSVDQLRLEFDHTGYLEHLPVIYRDEGPASRALSQFLALAEASFTELEDETDAVQRLLDPFGAPTPFVASLARWLGLDRAPQWSTATLREAVAGAYGEAARRGTAAGLQAALRRDAGVDAIIEEPLVQSSWWALSAGEDSPDGERATSVLGVTTMLVGAEAQGAVLGSTATVDRSHLIGNDEFGAPLFDSVAHRFVVRVYDGAGDDPERLDAITRVLEREAPAHTEWTVCEVRPGFGIGVQSRLGIDAIVGGEQLPTGLGPDAVLGRTFVLGGEPAGRIGERAVIGVSTRLADSVVDQFSSTSVSDS